MDHKHDQTPPAGRVFPFAGTVFKNLFSRPVTTGYPYAPAQFPARMRGHIEIDIASCIGCGLCARSCPPGALRVDRAAGSWTIDRFDCVQCGNCVNVCPKKCLAIVPGYTAPAPQRSSETFTRPQAPNAAPAPAGGKPVNDTSKCVYCGLCARKCPQGALTVDRAAKSWQLDAAACIGCGLCAAACPKKCLALK